MVQKEREKTKEIQRFESNSLPNETEMMSLLMLSARNSCDGEKLRQKKFNSSRKSLNLSLEMRETSRCTNNPVFVDAYHDMPPSLEPQLDLGNISRHSSTSFVLEYLDNEISPSAIQVNSTRKKSPRLDNKSSANIGDYAKSITHTMMSDKGHSTKYKSHSRQSCICDHCGKVYKHPNCLSKHKWEHTAAWRETTKLSISKHQQVQLLEAASVLIGFSNPHSTELLLPNSKSLQSSNTSYSPTNTIDFSQFDGIHDDEMRSDDESIGSESRIFKMEEL